MAHKKQTKRSHIKRCAKRVLGTIAVLIVVACVVMVVYMALLEYGVVKLNPKDQVRAEESTKSNEVDTTSLYQEKERSVEIKLEEQHAESNEYTQNQRAEQSNVDTAKESDEVSEKEDTTNTSPKVIEVKTIGEVKQENVDMVESALKLMPQELIDSYVENDWKTYVTKENLQLVYNKPKPCMALTDHTNHLIKYEDRESISIYTVMHENAGHYLESAIFKITCVNPSTTSEFMEIYNEECATFKVNTADPGYIITNSREFFAEMVCYYILDPSKCTPKAYEYVETQLNILKEKGSD